MRLAQMGSEIVRLQTEPEFSGKQRPQIHMEILRDIHGSLNSFVFDTIYSVFECQSHSPLNCALLPSP